MWQSHATNLASPTELYHQCAITLLKAGRYQDTVTVCDKVLSTDEGVTLIEKGMKQTERVHSLLSDYFDDILVISA